MIFFYIEDGDGSSCNAHTAGGIDVDQPVEVGLRARCAGAEAGADDADVSVLGQQCSAAVRLGLDQHAGPVAMKFEEQRVGEVLAVSGSALDENASATPVQQLVDKLRPSELRETRTC